MSENLIRQLAEKNFSQQNLHPLLLSALNSSMYYVYLIKLKNNTIYIGFTTDLKERIKTHRREKQIKGLIYYEAYQNKNDALDRERQLKKYKSAWGHLKKRIKISTESI